MRELLISVLLLLAATHTSCSQCDIATKVLEDDLPLHVSAKSNTRLDLYASNAMDYSPLNLFVDKFVSINLTDPDSFLLYQGSNCTEVVDNYNNDNRFFGLFTSNTFSWRRHQFYPFNSTVIGISTQVPYKITISTTQISVIRLGTFVCGIMLFLLASEMVRNTVVYYTSGCTFGILASLLLVAFIVWRVTPKKTIGIPILLGGWSVSLYMLHFAWSNFSSLIVQYQYWVAAYFGVAILISFALCYKNGPPTDARSHDIAQWFLQLFAIIMLYVSCQVSEISLSTTVILIVHEVTKSWKWGVAGIFKKTFSWILFCRSELPRLLSEEEYENQSREATRVELDRLRSYCRSPEIDAWKLAGRVKDPKRFARFVDGVESHISDDEEEEHMHSAGTLDRYGSDDLNISDAWDGEITIRSTPYDGQRRTIQIPLSARNLENLLKRANRSGHGSSLRVQASDRRPRSSLPLPKKSVSDTGPRTTPTTSRLTSGGSPSRSMKSISENPSSRKDLHRKLTTNRFSRDEYYSSDSEGDQDGNRSPEYSDS